MNPGFHQVIECAIDQSMTRDRRFLCEGRRDDKKAVVGTAFGAFMAGMQGRIVDQFQPLGFEVGQPFANDFFNAGRFSCGVDFGCLAHVGKTFLKGFTVTLA